MERQVFKKAGRNKWAFHMILILSAVVVVAGVIVVDSRTGGTASGDYARTTFPSINEDRQIEGDLFGYYYVINWPDSETFEKIAEAAAALLPPEMRFAGTIALYIKEGVGWAANTLFGGG